MTRPCPLCPDGSVWNSNGPTGRKCPACNGKAYIGDDDEPSESEEQADDWPAYMEDER